MLRARADLAVLPFDSPDLNLGELLRDVGSGKIRLPDFQRYWKWDTDRITALARLSYSMKS